MPSGKDGKTHASGPELRKFSSQGLPSKEVLKFKYLVIRAKRRNYKNERILVVTYA